MSMQTSYQLGYNERKLLIITVLIILIVVIVAAAFISIKGMVPTIGEISVEAVGLIKIKGTLAESHGFTVLGPTTGIQSYIDMLEEARKDPSIKAVLLYVDSPGGTVSASERLYYEVEKLTREKIVVAYIEGYGASGAYMMILPSKKIIASESSLVGSIGVYTIIINYRGLLDRLGITVYTFKSGKLKDVGSPYRNMTMEDKKVYEEIVRDFFKIFKERVNKYRVINDPEAFTGRPYTTIRAKEIGLIDDIGTLEYAINETKRLAGLPPDAPVRELKPPKPGLLDILFGSFSNPRVRVIPSQEILAIWPPPVIEP